jgi:hypothetical protein
VLFPASIAPILLALIMGDSLYPWGSWHVLGFTQDGRLSCAHIRSIAFVQEPEHSTTSLRQSYVVDRILSCLQFLPGSGMDLYLSACLLPWRSWYNAPRSWSRLPSYYFLHGSIYNGCGWCFVKDEETQDPL